MNLILAAASAALLVLSFPRFDLAPLAAVALAPLLVACVRERSLARRFLLGEAAGILYWLGTCYWIQHVLETYGGLGFWGSWGAVLLFSVAKALHLAVFAAAVGPLMRRWWAIPASAALWVAIERTHGPLGFAWQALGNAGISMGVPLRLAPFTGVYGLSFVFAMLSAALAVAFLGRRRRELAWLAALAVLPILPALPEQTPGAERAVLVQPNIPQDQSWTREALDSAVNRLSYLTLQPILRKDERLPDLAIWPEVPAPFHYDADAGFRRDLASLAHLIRRPLLAGVVAHTPEGDPLNSAVLLGPGGELLGRYDKMYLVPFGEFVPRWFGFVNRITQETGDFAAGKKVVVFETGRRKIGAFICYEAAFPHLVRRFAAGGAEVLVNLSNDGYFGQSAAREQHLKIARMRAVENRRWLLRATNNGYTAVVDPAGRITASLPPDREASLPAAYSYVSEISFYTRYGDWFVALCTLVSLAALWEAAVTRGG
ncbi:MAG: apolipoprotein N-acyltransferase [Bryobacteraceae bacterium]|nr:apolipoprotein N-acyltransferase [Bryobacteraceae bacterium]